MNVQSEVKRLSGLTVAQLRDEFERVSGEPTRSNNRAFLVKRIAWRLQSAKHGGLSERAKARAAELARDQDLRTRPRPEVHAAYGEVITGRVTAPTSELPPAGSLITREYRGRRLEVRVLDNGFSFEGQTFKSLTAIANHVTGAAWNGRLFFGLTKREGSQ